LRRFAGAVAKEVIAWLLKRTTSIGSTSIAWLKNHRRYIGLAIEAAVLIFGFWVLFYASDDSKPATRGDVRTTAVFIVIFFGMLEQFGRHIREVRDLYRKPQ
jgi:hypothetical protein